MKRVRLASCGAMAALTALLSGCMSSDPCGRPSFFSRFGCRPRCCSEMTYQAPTMTPVSAAPLMSGIPFTGVPSMPSCCNGGDLPPSAMPGESWYSGPILTSPGPMLDGGHDAFPGPLLGPGKMGAPIMMPHNGSPPMQGGPVPPPQMLPAPLPDSGGVLPLTPVPNGGFAQPTPANPSSRRR